MVISLYFSQKWSNFNEFCVLWQKLSRQNSRWQTDAIIPIGKYCFGHNSATDCSMCTKFCLRVLTLTRIAVNWTLDLKKFKIRIWNGTLTLWAMCLKGNITVSHMLFYRRHAWVITAGRTHQFKLLVEWLSRVRGWFLLICRWASVAVRWRWWTRWGAESDWSTPAGQPQSAVEDVSSLGPVQVPQAISSGLLADLLLTCSRLIIIVWQSYHLSWFYEELVSNWYNFQKIQHVWSLQQLSSL